MNNLKSKILETVQKNNIKMIPKWKFVLYSALGVIGIWFVFLVLVFVVSLIFFVLSRYGFMDMPFFGFMQTLHALGAIPFALFFSAVLLLIIVEVIARTYTFTFKRPLAVTLLSITFLVTIISYGISQTSAHEYVRDYMKSHQLDMLSRAYDRPTPQTKINGMDVLRGEVQSVTATSAVLRLFNGETVMVYATTSGGISTMPKVPSIGEDVVMIGTFIGDHFEVIRTRPAHRGPFGKPPKTNNEVRKLKMIEKYNSLESSEKMK